MILAIPDKVSWKKAITNNSMVHYNKNTTKRIQKTHANSEAAGITYEMQPITKEILDWFVPVYAEKISQKNSPLVIDLYAKTLEKTRRQFFILIIFENGIKAGGIIFSETETDVNIAYKIFDDSWTSSTLPAGPSLYSDYLITEHGFNTGRQFINHGKDRNGYGKTSSIGLAMFKIALGYKPYLPKKFLHTIIDVATIDCDSLYFTIQTNTLELQGNLFTTVDTKEKWVRLDSYKENVNINWIIRE